MSDRRGKERKQGSRAKVMRLHAAGDFDRCMWRDIGSVWGRENANEGVREQVGCEEMRPRINKKNILTSKRKTYVITLPGL